MTNPYSSAVATTLPDWSQAKFFLNGLEIKTDKRNILLREQENKLSIKFESGGVKTLRLGVGDNNENLNVESDPPLGHHVYPDDGDGSFNWTIQTENNRSGVVQLVLYTTDMALPAVIDSVVISSNLGNELMVLVRDVALPPGGATFNAGETYPITVSWNDSAMAGTPLKLNVVPDAGLAPSDFNSVPPLGQPTTDEWRFTAASGKQGTFNLKASTESNESELITAKNQLKSNAPATVTVWFMGVERQPGATLYPPLGRWLELEFRRPQGAPVTKHTLSILKGAPGGMRFTPAGTQDLGTVWKIFVNDNAANQGGTFTMSVTFEKYATRTLNFNLDF
ncbi:hypothetical protein [Pseudomonas migulae]|uniref:hypothetical protein n=1 Tax=Pseudomonas migulae TaxID=78543 RepID=UPI0009FFF195|nr:hypothetical protein [Pseudomonas migulae]